MRMSVGRMVRRMTIEEDIALIEELLEYKKLGTLEEVEEAVGKQTAEKPRKVLGIHGNVEYECGYCGESEDINEMFSYCPWCGQRIDFGEDEENERYGMPLLRG